ncbi:TetR/AcrR family transcriptional regulator [Streptomyces corynorhini]|uniref:TetR/AcrR family transcriptional regulator n=1 Tax=Streptomyces corynorhini TaxID=2282652 RepID=A0A370B8R4_9ACTN|nr:TetR/AcrR family transcriptional regulator [Streptomyces corynorhini]RDG38197.1 TetR/AcrR family transcriptional regulator [Streptomyces corynorhini]
MTDQPPLRADARRNRAHVLEVAARIFAAEGLSVPVHEIARRAGVGTGTVSRHFPTKEDLFGAILRVGVEELVRQADALAERAEPGPAFFAFLAATVRTGAANRGLAEQLAVSATTDQDAQHDRMGLGLLCDRTGDLLDSAQKAGAVRADVALDDVNALMAACMARGNGPSLEPMIAVVSNGLRVPRTP